MKHIEITSDKQLKAMRELEFKQNHSLTEARMVTTACEFDLLSMILANHKEDDTLYRIHIKDIEYITGRQWNHEQLSNATQKMGSHMFRLDLPDRISQIWLFSSVDYLKGSATIEIDINKKAMPLLANIKENGYTSIQLKSTLSLTSIHAKRIYGLCCKWANLGYIEYEISELKRILNVIDGKGKDSYPLTADLKKRVLEVAKKQINEHTNIQFDYKLIKKFRSRSNNYIGFYINKQKAKQLVIDFEFSTEQNKFIKDLIVYGFTEYQAKKIVPILSRDDWEIMAEELNFQVRTKKTTIDNSIAFLCGVLQKKYKIEGLITKNN
jgi:plasmid replication initiation protein